MVQFNLLPDVKVEFIKAQRSKHGLTVIAVVTSAVCVGIFVVSFIVANIAQKQYLSIVNDDITSLNNKLKSVEDVNKILTVQNQLAKLTELHERKPVTSRVFGYLTQVTPKDTSLSKLTLYHTLSTMIVGGKATSLDAVRVYADTLKATEYEVGDTKKRAFSEVVLTNFTTGDNGTNFTISMKFDPIIFDGRQQDVRLIVPVNAGANKQDLFKEDK